MGMDHVKTCLPTYFRRSERPSSPPPGAPTIHIQVLTPMVRNSHFRTLIQTLYIAGGVVWLNRGTPS